MAFSSADNFAHGPIPLVVVTGYLGAGKTTLVRRLLPAFEARGLHGLLLVNEAGDVNIDGPLLAGFRVTQRDVLGGCVCCSLRGDLYAALTSALDQNSGAGASPVSGASRKDAGETPAPQPPIDYVLLETSGIADPVEVIDALTAPSMAGRVEVRDVLTVVDAANAAQVLRMSRLVPRQLAFASAAILTKTDRIGESETRALVERIATMTGGAPVIAAIHGEVDAVQVLARTLAGCGAGIPAAGARLTAPEPGGALEPGGIHAAPTAVAWKPAAEPHDESSHMHGHDAAHAAHQHHYALSVALPEAVDAALLLDVLGALPREAWRVKGFARVRGSRRPWLFQRVGELAPHAAEFLIEGVDLPMGMVLIGPRLTRERVAAQIARLGGRFGDR